MGASSIILSTVVLLLCVSMWSTVVSSPVAVSDVQQPAVDVAHHLQRREVIFRPLFAYRDQLIEKKRITDARDQNQIDQAEYERQMQAYEQQLQQYEQQMQQYQQQYGNSK
ncbi:probable serine/threonine-protein kinase kinX [Topomyia yanbarensis]|uniref:probable serine/threonine-protein kinase kinX n=1 Tax=Topomyia yanbarensis TaxID=2498891 RepID=UPI00273B0F86|nr:probable serine/threonine-protein kinase kinX [Topomyia yanbarensis]